MSGFRAKNSTSTVMLKVTDDVLRAFERREMMVLLLLDFIRAFDGVNHRLMANV